MLSRKNIIAVYKDGNYFPDIDDLLVDYLLKTPKSITLKLVDSDDISGHILPAITNVLNELQPKDKIDVNSSPLIIARKLVSIIDRLPPWVLKTKTLSKQAIKFREIVKSANDPYKLLFEDIEKVFLDENLPKNVDKSTYMIKNFKETMLELMNIYPETMKGIALLLTNELDIPIATSTHLEKLRERAKNIKGISGNFRVDAFAARIADKAKRYLYWSVRQALNLAAPALCASSTISKVFPLIFFNAFCTRSVANVALVQMNKKNSLPGIFNS